MIKKLLFVVLSIGYIQGLIAQQDSIFKANGEKIACKIIEVGTNGVSYKKATLLDGPVFVDSKEDIIFIKYQNGQKQEFLDFADNRNLMPNTNKRNEQSTNTPSTLGNRGPISDQYKIIFDGRKYYVNNQKIGRKDVDRLLSRSVNPAVKIPFKTAKLVKTFQKIVGITSWPSTITGGIVSISTFRTVIIEANHNGASMSSWVNAGLSFLGTLTFPITSKILKKQRDKLYDKTIDIYNVGKQ